MDASFKNLIHICSSRKKSTTYFPQITTQKTEKYLSKRRKLESNCLLACLPAHHVSTNNIFCASLLKTVLAFLANQAAQFISCDIGRPYFSQNLLLSFLLWYDFKIPFKSRGGGTFLYLASSVNIRLIFFN